MMMIFISALAVLNGCASGDIFATSSDTAPPDLAEGAGGDTDAADSADEAAPPVWYSFAATLSVADGQAVVDDAEGRLVLASADLTRSDCEALPASAVSVAEVPAVEEDLYVWWEFTLPVTGECAVAGLPQRLGVGIGALDPEVRARLGPAGLNEKVDLLYGAWLSDDGGETVFPFGYAEGGLETEANAPPTDDRFELVPLLLLALPPVE